MDAVHLDMFAEDPNNRPCLLSAIGEGVKNACGVYTENVLKFCEGLFSQELLKLCRKVCDRIAKEVA